MPKKSRRAVSVDVPYNVHAELERARQLLELDRQLAFEDASGSFVTDWSLFFSHCSVVYFCAFIACAY